MCVAEETGETDCSRAGEKTRVPARYCVIGRQSCISDFLLAGSVCLVMLLTTKA